MQRLTVLFTPRAGGAAMIALLVLGIAANAMLIQATTHPQPFFETRTAHMDAGGEGNTEADNADRIMRIQRSLKRLGFYHGPADGVIGPGTQAAILAFWADTGEAAPAGELVRVEAALRRAVALLPPVPDPRPDARILAVQQALARAAYGPLSTDGLAGPETAAAVRRFRQDHGMAVTGEIDDDLVARLIATGAMDSR